MSRPTPEQLVEWKREAKGDIYLDGIKVVISAEQERLPELQARILTLIEALEEVQKHVVKYDENSIAWLVHVDGANRRKVALEHGQIVEVRP